MIICRAKDRSLGCACMWKSRGGHRDYNNNFLLCFRQHRCFTTIIIYLSNASQWQNVQKQHLGFEYKIPEAGDNQLLDGDRVSQGGFSEVPIAVGETTRPAQDSPLQWSFVSAKIMVASVLSCVVAAAVVLCWRTTLPRKLSLIASVVVVQQHHRCCAASSSCGSQWCSGKLDGLDVNQIRNDRVMLWRSIKLAPFLMLYNIWIICL